jgi:hypothetical protein
LKAFEQGNIVQGLQAMYKFETSFEGPPNLHLSQTALKTMAACIDAFAGVISHSKDLTLTRQMAILEAINDHAYSLPVCCYILNIAMDCVLFFWQIQTSPVLSGTIDDRPKSTVYLWYLSSSPVSCVEAQSMIKPISRQWFGCTAP